MKIIKWGKDLNNRIFGVDWLDDGQTVSLLATSEIRIVRATSLETSCSVVSMEDYAGKLIKFNRWNLFIINYYYLSLLFIIDYYYYWLLLLLLLLLLHWTTVKMA